MQIVVEHILIETKEIVAIEELEYKYHGFAIYLLNGSVIKIGKKQVYDISNRDAAAINDRYRELQKRVKEYWEKDKTDIPILRY